MAAARRGGRGETVRMLKPAGDAQAGWRVEDSTLTGRRVMTQQPLAEQPSAKPFARRRELAAYSNSPALRLLERMRESSSGAVSTLLFFFESSPELRNALVEELAKDAEFERALAGALKHLLEGESDAAESVARLLDRNERFFTLSIMRAKLKRSSAEAVTQALREAGEEKLFELASEIRALLKTSAVASVKLEAARALEKLGDKSHETICLIEKLIAGDSTLETEAKKELQEILSRMNEKQ